jgi:hypothetical protein
MELVSLVSIRLADQPPLTSPLPRAWAVTSNTLERTGGGQLTPILEPWPLAEGGRLDYLRLCIAPDESHLTPSDLILELASGGPWRVRLDARTVGPVRRGQAISIDYHFDPGIALRPRSAVFLRVAFAARYSFGAGGGAPLP